VRSWQEHRSGPGARPVARERSWGVVVVGLLLVAGCATTEGSPRSLHYVDGELVYSRPPHARSYEAYLRARVALAAHPPRIEEALQSIEVALDYDPREPQLWTTRAEIEAEAGDFERAIASVGRALELRPGYVPAQQLMATLGGAGTATTAAAESSSAAARQP
jgi:tetratricopeptide (TPR) repeat protein